MKNIVIIATGGPIAGKGQNGKTVVYRAGEIDMQEILESLPEINKLAHLKAIQLYNIDSNEMDEQKWMTLSNLINTLVLEEDVDGIVVTHGTDCIEETSYYLTLTINTNKPVVLTGAMRPATATSADGPFNLYQAVSLACHNEAYGKGVMVLFSNTIYSGRDVQKVNNFKVDAFGQKTFGCLGYMQDEKAYFFSDTFKKHTVQSLFAGNYSSLPKVSIALFYAGATEDILYHLAEENEGIVLVGSGSGNYNERWKRAIEDLSKEGIIFVRSSRVQEGIVFDDDIFDPNHYCIPSNTLSGQKARVLLMLALKKTKNREQIRQIFNLY